MTDEQVHDGTGVEIVAVEISPRLAAELFSQPVVSDELIILPRRVVDGKGEYLVEDVQAMKMLRGSGVTTRLLHAREQRTTIGEFSANELIALSVFVTQALGEEAVAMVVQYLLARTRSWRQRGKSAILEIEVSRIRLEGDKRVIEGLKIRGEGDQVIDGIVRILGDAGKST